MRSRLLPTLDEPVAHLAAALGFWWAGFCGGMACRLCRLACQGSHAAWAAQKRPGASNECTGKAIAATPVSVVPFQPLYVTPPLPCFQKR